MKSKLIIIRYSEIGLKAKYTRKEFENQLIYNIKKIFKKNKIKYRIEKEWGRIYLYSDENKKSITILKKIFGIKSISPAIKTETKINNISEKTLQFIKDKYSKEKKSFALRVRRSGKHNFTSQDIAIKVGQAIVDKTGLSVDLDNPDIEIFIEVRNKKSFIYDKKILGPAGLPLGTQGKIIATIDSEEGILAAWYMLKRGCETFFVINDVKLIKKFNEFLNKWYITAESAMINKESENYFSNMINIISNKNIDAIVTSHSLFTNKKNSIDQIKKIKNQLGLPILTPLISMDKKEIQKKINAVGIYK
ncbi:MAG: THUMP domain-containing protein [Candidatus Thermoplasmatota archaeon]